MRDLAILIAALGFVGIGVWWVITPHYHLEPSPYGVWKINSKTGEMFLCKVVASTEEAYCDLVEGTRPNIFEDLIPKE